jgi:CRISPR-associated protein Cas2
LRGELSRWMIEPKAGIFLGRTTARVRDKLWAKAVEISRGGNCVQIWSSNTEQGFAYRIHGDPDRKIIDVDGLHLVSFTCLHH